MSSTSPVDQINPSGTPTQPSGKMTCGACAATNPTGGQFCAGCGHALQEPCVQCSKPVLLTQSFCGNCGSDLVASLSKRKQNLETKIADAINAAKERDFEKSKGLLAVVTREKDYRFKDVIAHAKTAQQKIDRIAEQECGSAADRIAAAQQAYEAGDSARVVELLDRLSPKLMTPEAQQQLQRSRLLIEQLDDAEKSLQEAFQKRDWTTSGAILDRLLELKPEDQTVANLARKVGKKLVAKATTLHQNHKSTAAAEILQCVPMIARNQAYVDLNQTVERIGWLASQFKGEPFATPTLGRLSKHWSEQSGGDPRAVKMLDRLSQQVKAARSTPRDLFAPLDAKPRSWVGGPLGILATPTSIDLDDNAAFRASAGQFNAAIGLALQGLGLGRFQEDFSPKKGLLKRLGRKKAERCWGLDIGASGIKAVCLERIGEQRPRLVECHKLSFDTPLTRSTAESTLDESLRTTIESFLEQHEVESTPVWVSFPARELVSRFVKLPPVADKQVNALFEKEVESRIPLPLDEVACVRWIAPLPDDELTAIGRPAFVSAAKKQFVDRYLEDLSLAGLTVSGLQATPIALMNFATFEFADLLELHPADGRDAEAKLPTVALFDCGAEMTIAFLISGASCWFWSFESGGNEFTRLISRSTKTTHSDAEKLKRNPASLEHPETQFERVEQRIDEMRGRLSKLVNDQCEQHDEFDIQQTWCCGGGALTHGWIKRILCDI
ncbi:pilus assembly protein PilM [Stieleria sp. ICT_E10.1]|uniref:pilus assembly protein PilM n=1 Tax=Stieleria sedimenti TaxID=2976331 RepID=UPI0021805E8F|nr:pilus assembly protein PilM [Stieleria sedimenti]MCS7470355.1 pilus assembly protein PilM [Stieleria sedimenti]